MGVPVKTIYNSTFKYIVITGQIIALLPVNGTTKSVDNLSFQWKSFKFFYSVSVASVVIISVVFDIIDSFQSGFTEIILNMLALKIYAIAIIILNIRLASKWPNFMKIWSQIDVMMNKRYGRLKNFNFRMNVCLGIYFMMIAAGYIDGIVIISSYPGGVHNIVHHPYFWSFFKYIPYNLVFGFICFIVFSIEYFISNYNDLFIVTISMALALRFRQIRLYLEDLEKGKNYIGIPDFWLQIRKEYDRLSHLCNDLDDCINGLILISFCYNMYFVISYLFHQLLIENDESQNILFYCFFPVLLFKVFSVCLYTSWVNDESLGPVTILNSLPSRDYHPEVDRWLVQMSFDNVVLTGGKFFKVTRGIFLSVVSIIVTYELVAMQFHGFSTNQS